MTNLIFDEVNGSLSLLGDSKLDISAKTNTLDIKGNLLGENSSTDNLFLKVDQSM